MESKERATLATNEALRLRPQTVFSNILEGHKTFGDLAPQYGLTVEQFETLVLEKVGPKEFKRLKKASDTYEGYRKRTHKPKEVIIIPAEKLDQTTVPAESELEFSGTKPNSEEEKEDMEEKMIVLGKQRENAMREIKALTAKIEAKVALANSEENKVKKALEEVNLAEMRLKKAKANLAQAKKEQKDAEAELNDSRDSLKRWQECLQNIESQITELENQVVYLVAPGYHGEMPKHGKLISVVEMTGVTIEDTEGIDLVHPLSAEDMFLFDSMREAKEAYKYLRLVIKYACLGTEKYKLLVDSDEIQTLLRKQEVLISN